MGGRDIGASQHTAAPRSTAFAQPRPCRRAASGATRGRCGALAGRAGRSTVPRPSHYLARRPARAPARRRARRRTRRTTRRRQRQPASATRSRLDKGRESAPESRESRDKGAPVVARCVRATGTAAAFAAAGGGVRKTKKRGASQARTAAASRHRAGREGLHHGRHRLTLLHVLRERRVGGL